MVVVVDLAQGANLEVCLGGHPAADYAQSGQDIGCKERVDLRQMAAAGIRPEGKLEAVETAGADTVLAEDIGRGDMLAVHCMAEGRLVGAAYKELVLVAHMALALAACKVLVSIVRNSHLVVDHMEPVGQYMANHSANV